MDLASIGTAFTAIDLIRKGLSAAIDVRDFNQAAAELSKLNEALLSAQAALLAQNSALFQLQSEKFETAEKLRKLEEAISEKARYELFDLGGGVFVYRANASPSTSGAGDPTSTQPQHFLCQPCFDAGKKSVLRRWGDREWNCTLCKNYFSPHAGGRNRGFEIFD